MRALAPDIRRLEQQRYSPDAIERVVQELVSGTCGLLFNTPLDLLIERRLDAELPVLRPLQILSLVQLATEARTATLNPEIRQVTPRRILHAVGACNGAQALFLDHLSGGATRAYVVMQDFEFNPAFWCNSTSSCSVPAQISTNDLWPPLLTSSSLVWQYNNSACTENGGATQACAFILPSQPAYHPLPNLTFAPLPPDRTPLTACCCRGYLPAAYVAACAAATDQPRKQRRADSTCKHRRCC